MVADFKTSLVILCIPLLSLGIALLHASFSPESFRNEFVIFHLLHSCSFNVSSYRLMISNMTKNPVKVFGFEHVLQVVPILMHCLCRNKLERLAFEPMACYLSLFLLVCLFYGHIFMLTFQFLARNPDKGLIFMTEVQLKKVKEIEENKTK